MMRRFCVSRARSIPRTLAALAFVSSTVFGQENAVTLEDEFDEAGLRRSLEPVPEEVAASTASTRTDQPPIIVAEEASGEVGPDEMSNSLSHEEPRELMKTGSESPRQTAEISADEEVPLMKPYSFMSSILSEFFSLDEAGVAKGSPDNFSLSLGPRVGYDNNVLYAPEDPIASFTSGLSGSVKYDFGSPRWHVNSQLAAGVTYYDNRPSDPTDYNASLTLSASYQANRRLKIDFSTKTAYLAQPEPQLVGSVSRFSGDYWYTDTRISALYTLRPRLSLRTGYSLLGYQYTDEAINQGLGFYSQTFHLGIDYLLTPRTTVSVEYRYNPVTYYEADLGSEGHIFTVGFLHAFSDRMNWSLQAGAEQRRLTNPATDGPSEYLGPFFETSFSYEFGPRSSIFANFRYGTEPSGVSGVSIRETFRGSVGLDHALTARLTTSIAFNYSHDAYDQPGITSDFSQEVYSGTFSLRYRLNRGLALLGSYNYVGLFSDLPLNTYERSIVNLGLDIIF